MVLGQKVRKLKIPQKASFFEDLGELLAMSGK
jgi:hypothetical protein